MEPIRVLVVDDHPAFAMGLRLLLERDPRVQVVGIAGSIAEALALTSGLGPDVVLMDQCLGSEEGISAIDRLRALRPGIAVIVLTGAAGGSVISGAVEAGAVGVLEKTVDPTELVRAIERAREGDNLFSPMILVEAMRARSRGEHEAVERERVRERLTPRERDVLALLADGCDTKGIATRLGLSVQTVRAYVQEVIEKLDAHSRVEAILNAERLGVIHLGA